MSTLEDDEFAFIDLENRTIDLNLLQVSTLEEVYVAVRVREAIILQNGTFAHETWSETFLLEFEPPVEEVEDFSEKLDSILNPVEQPTEI